MKKMVLKDFQFGEFKFPNAVSMTALGKLFKTKLEREKILFNMKMTDSTIEFELVANKDPLRLFMYAGHNHVKLKADSPLAIKNKRDYLLTHRLTEKQVNVIWDEIINGTLDKLGVSCHIYLQEFADDPASVVTMRRLS